MNPPIPMSAKILIGAFSVLAVGTGIWGAYAIKHKANPTPVSTASTDSLPSTISTALSQTNSSSLTPSTSSSDSSSTSSSSSAPVKNTAPVKQLPKAKNDGESTLTSTLSIATGMNQITISVIANQPIVIGFAPLASSFADSDFSTAKSMTVQSPTGVRTLVVRTKGGQEMTYSVNSSSNTSSSAVSLDSSSSSSGTSFNIQSSAN